ncbi:MAG: tetratricopeptide repeat protein [Limnospira sp.]
MSPSDPSEIAAIQSHQEANFYLSQRRYPEAIAACQTALKHRPNFAPAYKTLGTIQQLQGQFSDAKNSYQKAIEIQPGFAEVYANLGSLFAQKQDWESAIATYETAIRLQPNFGGAYRNLAKVLTRIGRPDEAIDCWLTSISIEPNYLTVKEYINLGDDFQNRGKIESAIALYSKAIEVYPDVPAIPYKWGEVLAKAGQFEVAIAAYQNAIKLNRNQFYFYSRLGDAFIERGQLEDAIAAYREAVKLKPDLDWLHFKLADLESKAGNLEEAIGCYERGIAIKPDVYWPYLKLGEILKKIERWDGIIFHYQNLLKYNPEKSENTIVIYKSIATASTYCNRWDMALEYYQKISEIDPQNFNAYLQLAQLLMQQDKRSEAVEAYLKAVEIKPDFLWSYWNLWNILTQQDKLDVVLEFYRREVHNFPETFSVDLNLGEILSQKGQVREAIASYRTASHKKLVKSHPEIVRKYWDDHHPIAPKFLIIGTQKGGTTSLQAYLEKHPQILGCIKKEVYFWSVLFFRGLDWYLAHFPHLSPGANFLTGEATPHYLEFPEVPGRISKMLPKTKIIVLLRNPVDRALSHYHHWLRFKWEKRSFEEAIASELELLSDPANLSHEASPAVRDSQKFLWRGLYFQFLQNWLSVFPREQLLILRSEDLYENPQHIYDRVSEFLELPAHQLDEYRRHNPGNYTADRRGSIYSQMRDFFRPHNQKLEELLGWELNWD